MKKIHKILLTVSFVFAVCFSAGLFFTYSDFKSGNYQDTETYAWESKSIHSFVVYCLQKPVTKTALGTFTVKDLGFKVTYTSQDGWEDGSVGNFSIGYSDKSGVDFASYSTGSGKIGDGGIGGSVTLSKTWFAGDQVANYKVNYYVSAPGYEVYTLSQTFNALYAEKYFDKILSGDVTLSSVSDAWGASSYTASIERTTTLKTATNSSENVWFFSYVAPRRYKVTFDANGGSGGGDSTITYGNKYRCPTPTREGFTFEGWYRSNGERVYYDTFKTSPDNETLTARWTDSQAPTVHRATWQQNGATGYYAYAYVTDNDAVARVQFPTWTELNGQDDIQGNWSTSSAASGSYGSWTVDGQSYNYRYEVKVADHNNEYGLYHTHIYAYDPTGNRSSGSSVGSVTFSFEFDINQFVNGVNNGTDPATFSVKIDGVVEVSNVHDFCQPVLYGAKVEIYDIKYPSNYHYTGYKLASSYTSNIDDLANLKGSGSSKTNIIVTVPNYRSNVNLQIITNHQLTINDGLITQVKRVFDKSLYALSLPTRPGYIFTGWTVSGSGKMIESQYLKDGKTFNGTSDYVSLGRTHMYTDKFLFSVWASMDDWSEFKDSRILSCTEGGGWNMQGADVIDFIAYQNGVGYVEAFSDKKWSSLSSGWHNFVGTFTGNELALYIDGELVALSKTFTNKAVSYHPTNSIIIGAEPGGGTDIEGKYFKGQIANVILYNDFVNTVDGMTSFDQEYYFLAGNSDTTITANWIETWAGAGKDVELTTDASGAYLISSAEELGKIAYEVSCLGNTQSGNKFKLVNNIDLAGKYWMPIGTHESRFKGEFDGNNFTISNVKSDYFNDIGLFGKILDTSISNLILSQIDIKGGDYAGGLVGVATNSQIKNCKILSGSVIGRTWVTGGICGCAENSTIIENCVNSAKVESRYHGGICGLVNTSRIIGCINYGTIENYDEGSDYYYGGIAGKTYGNGVIIEKCINYGEVSNKKGVDGIAGILGSNEGENTAISACANYGNIISKSGSTRFSGAIVGRNDRNDLLIENCSSNCEMSGKGSAATWVSVLCGGEGRAYVKSSYASMTVAGESVKHAYGNAEDFNKGFRFVSGMNNDLPMQVDLFEYASQIPMQSDVLSVGLTGFELIG